MILLSAAESRELDRLSQERFGIESYTLMKRAGEAVAEAVARRWPEALSPGSTGVLVVAGKGNNGGDGLISARRLTERGARVSVLLLARPDELRGDAARAHAEYVAAGGAMVEAEAEKALPIQNPALVIDAIFGTGLNAEVRGQPCEVMEAVNRADAPVVAVDIASGVNADTGAVLGTAIRATVTVTFGFAKYGHVSYPGAGRCGELEIADIGFAPGAIAALAPRGRMIELGEATRLVKLRPANSHKGTYGHVLGIAGSRGKSGAAILLARGALFSGAGLVTAAVPEAVAAIVATGQAELMTEPVHDRGGHFEATATIERLREIGPGKTALVIGPGIGASDDSGEIVRWLLSEGARPECPLVIDADGLNVMAPVNPQAWRSASGPVVVTPHPGEMARLLDLSIAAVNADRISAARRLASVTGAHVLLKGARSVMVSPGGTVHINSSGNPGMATPGMGDVLSGILGALLARGMSPFDALDLGVFAHGYAADRLSARIGNFGYLASDLAKDLPGAFTEIAAHSNPDVPRARGLG